MRSSNDETVRVARRLACFVRNTADVRIPLTRQRKIMRASTYVACAIVALAVLGTTGISSAQNADGSIVIVRKNFPTPGREDELQSRWLKLVQFLRKAEPNAVFQLHRTTKEPVTL